MQFLFNLDASKNSLGINLHKVPYQDLSLPISLIPSEIQPSNLSGILGRKEPANPRDSGQAPRPATVVAAGAHDCSVSHGVAAASGWALLIGQSVGRPQEVITLSFKDSDNRLLTPFASTVGELSHYQSCKPRHDGRATHQLAEAASLPQDNQQSSSAGLAQLRHVLRTLMGAQGTILSWAKPSGESSVMIGFA